MVYVYAANVKNLPDPIEAPEIMEGLPEERKQKIASCKQLKDRKQSLGAGLLLKQVLLLHGVSMGKLLYGENGKPEMEGIHFNLSHSHDMVVCVLSSQPVGCDIEKIKEKNDRIERIANRFFTGKECTYLNAFQDNEKNQAFFRIWTIKESYIKMTGEGLRLGLDRFEIVFGKEVELYREGERCSCTIQEYEIPEYKVSVCAEEREFSECIVLEL